MKSNCPQCLINNEFYHIGRPSKGMNVFGDDYDVEYNCKECGWVGDEEDLISKEEGLRQIRKIKILKLCQ